MHSLKREGFCTAERHKDLAISFAAAHKISEENFHGHLISLSISFWSRDSLREPFDDELSLIFECYPVKKLLANDQSSVRQ